MRDLGVVQRAREHRLARRMRILGLLSQWEGKTLAELRDALQDDPHTMKLNRFDEAIHRLLSDGLIINDLGVDTFRRTDAGHQAWVEHRNSQR